MVLSGHFCTNSRFHETRKGRQDIDRRIDLSIVQLTVNIYLTLSNITGQVGNRMGNVVVRHSENGDLSYGSASSLNTTCSLVD